MTTFSGSYNGIQLTGSQNPATIAATGYVGPSNDPPRLPAFVGDARAGVAWNVTNYGTVNGQLYDALFLSIGSTVTNKQGGLIEGTFNGVIVGSGGTAGSAGTVFNYGTIVGHSKRLNGGTGVYIYNYPGASSLFVNGATGLVLGTNGYGASLGQGTVRNLGTIEDVGAFGSGVRLTVGGSIINGATNVSSSLISGINYGISDPYAPHNTALVVVNYGTIQATGSFGVGAPANRVTNGASGVSSARISGPRYGVAVGGRNALLVNYGTIVGTGAGGGAGLGAIIGNSAAVVHNYGTILGLGTIAGGLRFQVGDLTNGAGGVTTAVISGYKYGVLETGYGVLESSTASVLNLGTIRATGSQGTGVTFASGGSITNGASGGTTALIAGRYNGILVRVGAATVSNFGTIASTAGIGVNVQAGGTVGNGSALNSAAHVTGYDRGIWITGAAGRVANYGTIAATAATGQGIILSFGGNIINGSTSSTAALISGVRRGICIHNAAGTVINYGTIKNTNTIGYEAIRLFADGTIKNAGLILRDGNGPGDAVRIDFNGRVSNSGTIIGASTGIYMAGVGTVSNSGTIKATGATGIGVTLASPDSTVINAGTIIGQGGTAVSFAAGGGRLIVAPGASFGGSIAGGTGVVELAAGGGAAGVLHGFGSSITNFATLQFDTAARWTVEGGPGGLPAIITGFTAGNTIDLNGFVAVSDTFANNALVLTNTVGNHVTLGIQGDFTSDSFNLTGDGSGGTDVTVNGMVRSRDEFLIYNPNTGQLDIGEHTASGFNQYTPIGTFGAQLQFDGTGDFLGDGRAQFVLYNPTTGRLDIGEHTSSGFNQYTPIGTFGAQLQFDGTGDFLGDGRTQFLLYDPNTGKLDIGEHANSGFNQYTSIGTFGGQLKFDGTGDFLGDGRAQFLLYNPATGGLDIGEHASSGFNQYTPIGTFGGQLKFEGTGDFLGDGRAQVLLYNPTAGELDIGEHTSSGFNQYTPIGTFGSQLQFDGTGDFLGDGRTQFLVYDPNTGRLDIYERTGSGFNQYTPVGTFGSQLKFDGTGNFLGN